MPKKKHNELTAGLFVVAALLVTVGVVLWMGAADAFRPARQQVYFWVPEEVGFIGLEEGNPVKINDATVGKIVRIKLDPKKKRTLYIAEIEAERISIHTDGEACSNVPFIGAASLVIKKKGSPGAPLADEKNPIELDVGGILGKINSMSDTLAEELNEENKESLLVRIRSSVERVQLELDPDREDSLMANLRASVKNVNDVTTTMRDELDRKKPDSLLAKTDKIVTDLQKTAENVNAVSAGIRAETDRTNDKSLLAKVHETLDSVETATQNVTAVTASLRAETDRTKKDSLLAKIRAITDDVQAVTSDATPKLKIIMANVTDVAEQLNRMLAKHQNNVDEVIDNLTVLSVDLKSLGKELRLSPWKLLNRPDKPELHAEEIANAARAFATGAAELDQAILKLARLTKDHPDGIPAGDPKLRDVRLHIEKTFKKFSDAEQRLWKELKVPK